MATTKLAAATTTYPLGDSGMGQVSTKVVEINLGTGPLVGSFALQGRLAGFGGTFVPVPYKRRVLNGAASDDTIVSAAITTGCIIEINAAGIELQLVWTYTSGATSATAVINWLDLIG